MLATRNARPDEDLSTAHDDEIEEGICVARTRQLREACHRERDRRVAEAKAEAAGLGAGEVLAELRDSVALLRPPVYRPQALRWRARDLGVEVPADWGTALELVPVADRARVVWARRVGGATLAALARESTSPARPVGPHDLVWLALYGRSTHQSLGHLDAARGWEMAARATLLEHEPAATLAEAKALLAEDFDGLEWRAALTPTSDELPYAAPEPVSHDARAAGALFKLPVWLRGDPHRPLAFGTKRAAAAAGFSGNMVHFAEGPMRSVVAVVANLGARLVLTRDGDWVRYDVDPRAYPGAVQPANVDLRQKVASLTGRSLPNARRRPSPSPSGPCENCARAGASPVAATAFAQPECSCVSPEEHAANLRDRRRGCEPAEPAGVTPLALCPSCASDDWSHCGVCGRWCPVGALHADPMGEIECARCARERTGIAPTERVLTEGEDDPRWLLMRGGGTYENGPRSPTYPAGRWALVVERQRLEDLRDAHRRTMRYFEDDVRAGTALEEDEWGANIRRLSAVTDEKLARVEGELARLNGTRENGPPSEGVCPFCKRTAPITKRGTWGTHSRPVYYPSKFRLIYTRCPFSGEKTSTRVTHENSPRAEPGVAAALATPIAPLSRWKAFADPGRPGGDSYRWAHPILGWVFIISPSRLGGYDASVGIQDRWHGVVSFPEGDHWNGRTLWLALHRPSAQAALDASVDWFKQTRYIGKNTDRRWSLLRERGRIASVLARIERAEAMHAGNPSADLSAEGDAWNANLAGERLAAQAELARVDAELAQMGKRTMRNGPGASPWAHLFAPPEPAAAPPRAPAADRGPMAAFADSLSVVLFRGVDAYERRVTELGMFRASPRALPAAARKVIGDAARAARAGFLDPAVIERFRSGAWLVDLPADAALPRPGTKVGDAIRALFAKHVSGPMSSAADALAARLRAAGTLPNARRSPPAGPDLFG